MCLSYLLKRLTLRTASIIIYFFFFLVCLSYLLKRIMLWTGSKDFASSFHAGRFISVSTGATSKFPKICLIGMCGVTASFCCVHIKTQKNEEQNSASLYSAQTFQLIIINSVMMLSSVRHMNIMNSSHH